MVICPFVLFLFAIVLSVLLRFTDSDYAFGIFKLFLHDTFCVTKIEYIMHKVQDYDSVFLKTTLLTKSGVRVGILSTYGKLIIVLTGEV